MPNQTPNARIRVLIKGAGRQGLAAHIVGAEGTQLCKAQIKRGDWEIHERSPDGLIICAHCRRIWVGRR